MIIKSCNSLLTKVNLVLAIFVFSAGLPKKYETIKIPPVVNIVIVLLLAALLFYYISGYSQRSPQTPSLFV